MSSIIDSRVFSVLNWTPIHNLFSGTLMQSIFFTVFPFLIVLGYVHRTFIGVASGYSKVPEWKGVGNAIARGIGVSMLSLILLVIPMVLVYIPIAYSDRLGLILLGLLYLSAIYLTPAILTSYNKGKLTPQEIIDVSKQRDYSKGVALVGGAILIYGVLVLGLYGLYTLALAVTVSKLMYALLAIIYLLFAFTTYSLLLVCAIIMGVYVRIAYTNTDYSIASVEESDEVPVTV